MTDRPILFSAPMVRALLAGRKTQTRRKAWGDPVTNKSGFVTGLRSSSWQRVAPGDRLWVREAWRALQTWDCLKPSQLADDPSKITYEADPEKRNSLWAFGKLRPGMFMPRWASRLTLTVTEVRWQRLQEISGGDAYAEGATMVHPATIDLLDLQPPSRHGTKEYKAWEVEFTRRRDAEFRKSFSRLWDDVHGAGAWAANPEVVALTFIVERRNIDVPARAA